jgi:hypothetical protein
VLQLEILIRELVSVDGTASSALCAALICVVLLETCIEYPHCLL